MTSEISLDNLTIWDMCGDDFPLSVWNLMTEYSPSLSVQELRDSRREYEIYLMKKNDLERLYKIQKHNQECVYKLQQHNLECSYVIQKRDLEQQILRL